MIFQMLPDYFLADGTRHSFSCCGEMFDRDVETVDRSYPLFPAATSKKALSRRGLPPVHMGMIRILQSAEMKQEARYHT